MNDETIDRVLVRLAESEPTYHELWELHRELLSISTDNPETNVERYALARVIEEILGYLDFVGEELEKSFGFQRSRERQRILDGLAYSETTAPIDRVDKIVCQWEDVTLYSIDSVVKEQA